MTRAKLPADPHGRRRVVIEHLRPAVDGGRWPAKRTVDEAVEVTVDAFADGHDRIHCVLAHRHEARRSWVETPMEAMGNDRWRAEFVPDRLGRFQFTVTAWVDHFGTWRTGTAAKVGAEVDVAVEAEIGARLLDDLAARAPARVAARARAAAEVLRIGEPAGIAAVLDDDDLAADAARHGDRTAATTYEPPLEIDVDRPLARFGAWYELFPRSTASEPGRHGTFADTIERLDAIAAMGFDVVYLPPVHPIGTTARKGPNNSLRPGPDDVGSPWAIGSELGGHDAVHPDLGTLADFRALVAAARARDLEIALDIAFQCSPDHPWVHDHPEWFRMRPDGTVQYAENPPKRYEDIYPFDFESDDWPGLWSALRDVFDFWIGQGVTVFRVDNPHTKAFPFWEWLVADLRRRHPEVVLLSEAFTRPRVMERLAKIGFHQSYTYFAWRNTAAELREYFEELTATEVAEYLRPNVWPNTPDILTEYLQHGGRPAFAIRIVLATTLAAAYGVYGPAFELVEHLAREPGSEEYLDSEKYQLRTWEHDRPDSLAPLVTRLNRIRRAHPALHSNRGLRFHRVEHDQILCYSKRDHLTRDVVLCTVNCDPHRRHAGFVDLDLGELGVDPDRGFLVEDLVGGATYEWHGPRNWVDLDPQVLPAHVFSISRPREPVPSEETT